MAVDYKALNALHERTRSRDTTVGQAFVEQWGLDALTEVEAEAREARDEWARAIAEAWPEVRAEAASAHAEGVRAGWEQAEAKYEAVVVAAKAFLANVGPKWLRELALDCERDLTGDSLAALIEAVASLTPTTEEGASDG